MTEQQQISRTCPAESLRRPKNLPLGPSCGDYVGTPPQYGGKAISILPVALLAPLPPGCCKFYPTRQRDYGDAVSCSVINRIASGRCGMQKASSPQEMKRALIITVVLIVSPDFAGGGRAIA